MPRFQRGRAHSKSRRVLVRGRKGGKFTALVNKRKTGGFRGRKRVIRRRGTNRRGKRRGGYRKGRQSQRRFEAQLIKAEGQRVNFTRNIECQFQVPFATVHGGAAITEPTAQYMWPRLPDTTAEDESQGGFYSPEYLTDMGIIIDGVLGAGWYNLLNNSELYETKIGIAWKARYSVTNMSNKVVEFERLVFKIKRDVPSATGTNLVSLDNPFNMAGEYLYTTQDATSLDFQNASNNGLHTERNRIETIPTFNHWYKLLSKKKFHLGPGATKTHSIKRKSHMFSPIDMWPNVKPLGAISQPAGSFLRTKGNTFIIYKMFSQPADMNDTLLPLKALSTRTAPIGLLGYQCNYYTTKFALRKRTQFTPLSTLGFGQPASNADVVVMGNGQIGEVPNVNVV